MIGEIKELRKGVNEELVMAINEAMDYCNNYYNYLRDVTEDIPDNELIQDAKIIIALQDKVINLMKMANFEELKLAFPLEGAIFDDTDVYDVVLSTKQDVLNYIQKREHFNKDLEMFLSDRIYSRIVLGEF